MSRILLSVTDLFPVVTHGFFVSRPNRFVVYLSVPALGNTSAFMPNPGRLWELLYPGVRLWLADHGEKTERKHRFTVLAVERDGAPVFLHTHVNNLAAEALLRNGKVPGLEDGVVEQREVTVGRSRFDFLLRRNGHPVLVEVKSCTLFGQGVAMFPDAVTERGRRHVEELTRLSQEVYETAVVFVVHNPAVDWFMPDYHTDLAFTRTLLQARDSVSILPVAVHWSDQLALSDQTRLVPIPWDYVEQEAVDRGHYLLSFRIGNSSVAAPGHYVAAGWVDRELDAFLARCRKPPRRGGERLLALCQEAEDLVAIPIRSSTPLATLGSELAAFGRVLPEGPTRWDVDLVHCGESPFRTAPFQDYIERHRMRAPDV